MEPSLCRFLLEPVAAVVLQQIGKASDTITITNHMMRFLLEQAIETPDETQLAQIIQILCRNQQNGESTDFMKALSLDEIAGHDGRIARIIGTVLHTCYINPPLKERELKALLASPLIKASDTSAALKEMFQQFCAGISGSEPGRKPVFHSVVRTVFGSADAFETVD